MKLSERQKKLEIIMDEIDNFFGIGIGSVDENTDVDEFIEDFLNEFMVKRNLSHYLSQLNESINMKKTYLEILDELVELKEI